MRWISWLPAAGISLALILALGALSRVPYGDEAGLEEGVLRLSWRLRGARVEECRKLSPEELEALPIHMRRPEVCEGRLAPYRLRVTIDGSMVEDTLVRAAGARQDRPIYLFREISLPAGEYRVRIAFTRESGEATADGAGDRSTNSAPAQVGLDQLVTIQPGRYLLVTLDPLRNALVLRRGLGDEAKVGGGH